MQRDEFHAVKIRIEAISDASEEASWVSAVKYKETSSSDTSQLDH